MATKSSRTKLSKAVDTTERSTAIAFANLFYRHKGMDYPFGFGIGAPIPESPDKSWSSDQVILWERLMDIIDSMEDTDEDHELVSVVVKLKKRKSTKSEPTLDIEDITF